MCDPLWSAAPPSGDLIGSAASVANGVAYVMTFPAGGSGGHVAAYSMSCTTACTPIWTAPHSSNTAGQKPAIAGQVVYVGGDVGNAEAYQVGCAAGGGTCSPLWSLSGTGATSTVIVSDGVAYFSTSGAVNAYGP